MEKDFWHDQGWGGMRVRHDEAKTPTEPNEKTGDGSKAKTKRAPKFDGEYRDAMPESVDSDYDSYGEYDVEYDEESYNRGTVVGTALHGPKLGGYGGYEDMGMSDGRVHTSMLHVQLSMTMLSSSIPELRSAQLAPQGPRQHSLAA